MKPENLKLNAVKFGGSGLISMLVAWVFWLGAGGPGLHAGAGTLLATRAAAAASQPANTAVVAPLAPPIDVTGGTSQADTPGDDAATSASKRSVNIFAADPLESLAQALKRRQHELDEREQKIGAEQQRLDALRKEIEEKLAASQQVLKQMEQIAGNAAAERDKGLAKWIKVYEGMPPAQAGQVIAQMDLDFARELLTKMDPKKASKILAAFPQAKAVELGQKIKAASSGAGN